MLPLPARKGWGWEQYRSEARKGLNGMYDYSTDTRIIDSRDLIARAAELEANEDRDEDEDAELAAILELAEEVSEWEYGAGLIREDYFTEYAQELAEDIGAIDKDAAWPASYIDWDAAADALKMDYSAVKFLGFTYYVRA